MFATARTALKRGFSVILGVALVSGALMVACEQPPAREPLPDPTPKSQQRALRPRASTTAPTTPEATQTAAAATQPAARASAFVQVAVGENHSCALQGSGRVQCWGENEDGQVDVPEGISFQQVTAGHRFSCGIRADGGITCWGQNDHQQTEAPEGQFTAIDAGWDHVCALSDTDVTCWGWNANERATPPPGIAFSAIGAGAEHSCGLTLNGDLTCWGENDSGQATARRGPFQSLAVGTAHTCVIRNDGTPICQGFNTEWTTNSFENAFIEIAAGSAHTCGLLSGGSIHCWGHGNDAESKDPLPAPHGPFSQMSAGWTTTCALDLSGLARCWNYPAPARPAPPFDRLNFAIASPGLLFSQPTDLFPWWTGGLAVADREGFISVYDDSAESSLILDLREDVDFGGSLNGMLSAATDPEFSEYPFIYVYYTVRDERQGGKESTRLTRFSVIDSRAVLESALVILEIPMLPRPNIGFEGSSHYGGAIRFGTDGMLYLGIGDSHCFRCPQDLKDLHGKIIRIDIRDSSVEQPYRIPNDNPFTAVDGIRPEIWAYGLRNPWRMAFDTHDGRLWVGDVGHDSEEKVTIAEAGDNLGWPAFEGSKCLEIDESIIFAYGTGLKGYNCDEMEGVREPIHTYEITQETCAVIGGVTYRGNAISWLDGAYVYGDFCSGQVWVLTYDDEAGWQNIEIADLGRPISSFGVDAEDEVYVLTFGGPVLRLVEDESGYIPSLTIMPSETVVPDGRGSA